MEEINARIEEARRLLPAWFIPRMMGESWTYGLMLANGQTIAVERIDRVQRSEDGAIWLDVLLAPADDYWGNHYDPNVFGAPTTRRHASVNAAHIAAAFELSDVGQQRQGHGATP